MSDLWLIDESGGIAAFNCGNPDIRLDTIRDKDIIQKVDGDGKYSIVFSLSDIQVYRVHKINFRHTMVFLGDE